MNCSACSKVSGRGLSFVSGSGIIKINWANDTIASRYSGRSGLMSSKLTTAGATIDAMRAKVVTPATPALRPTVGNNSPVYKYKAGTVPC